MKSLLIALAIVTTPALADFQDVSCRNGPICTIRKFNPRPNNCSGKGCYNYCVKMDANYVECFNVLAERGEGNARKKAIALATELVNNGLCNRAD